MAEKGLANCVCCGQQGSFSIIVATGPNNEPLQIDRFYIPNQGVRDHIGTSMDVSRKLAFCGACMRAVEDNFRATILYLQAENGQLIVKSIDSD